jgi:hypothetical protein
MILTFGDTFHGGRRETKGKINYKMVGASCYSAAEALPTSITWSCLPQLPGRMGFPQGEMEIVEVSLICRVSWMKLSGKIDTVLQ